MLIVLMHHLDTPLRAVVNQPVLSDLEEPALPQCQSFGSPSREILLKMIEMRVKMSATIVLAEPSSRARRATMTASSALRTPAPNPELMVTLTSAYCASHESLRSRTRRRFFETLFESDVSRC